MALAQSLPASSGARYEVLRLQGFTLYRAGRYAEAAARLTEALREAWARRTDFEGAPQDWLFLAMTHHRLKDADQACKWLDRAVTWLDTDPAAQTLSWETALTLNLLRREAETLVKAKP